MAAFGGNFDLTGALSGMVRAEEAEGLARLRDVQAKAAEKSLGYMDEDRTHELGVRDRDVQAKKIVLHKDRLSLLSQALEGSNTPKEAFAHVAALRDSADLPLELATQIGDSIPEDPGEYMRWKNAQKLFLDAIAKEIKQEDAQRAHDFSMATLDKEAGIEAFLAERFGRPGVLPDPLRDAGHVGSIYKNAVEMVKASGIEPKDPYFNETLNAMVEQIRIGAGYFRSPGAAPAASGTPSPQAAGGEIGVQPPQGAGGEIGVQPPQGVQRPASGGLGGVLPEAQVNKAERTAASMLRYSSTKEESVNIIVNYLRTTPENKLDYDLIDAMRRFGNVTDDEIYKKLKAIEDAEPTPTPMRIFR